MCLSFGSQLLELRISRLESWTLFHKFQCFFIRMAVSWNWPFLSSFCLQYKWLSLCCFVMLMENLHRGGVSMIEVYTRGKKQIDYAP